jgi:catechol 2,3-dioxygenase-like lactoylglutathione lyase family enzyme
MFNRISHIGIVVSDIEAALRIWHDKLGFNQFWKPTSTSRASAASSFRSRARPGR